ncbi:MAG: bifunctional amidotransferase subunit GatB/aspartate--tRNA ligase AspS [Marinilabiliaceae bacterium]|nr:bifunctional amidotransferase subunit GatB/aspartate--tRNA ligase AspS [Marinilabiliaceae bacterium]
MEIDQLIKELDLSGLEVVIGLETHIRLNTSTKLFCACPNQETDQPNTNICPVCTGQMGVLPAVNKEAVRKAIYFGKAVQSSFKNSVICWDRKHYEYPDLPKNFQLTQFQRPIIPDGRVECYRNDGTTFTVELEQVHIEEDAAKLVHERKQTLVDFNKGGVPLIEVVTKPCIHNIQDAATYAQYLQRIVQNLQISDANLEKGEFKSDVSVSLRKKGTNDLNPRAEIKNLNSFKFIIEATVEEVTKQFEYFKTHNTPRPEQSTVLFDADLKQTKTMRKKEFAADYRYALEPDIPFVNIKEEIDSINVDASLLPFSIETTLIKGGVRPQDAKFFTSDAIRSKVFLGINKEVNDPLFVAKTLTNNLKADDYSRVDNIDDFAKIFQQFKEETISIVLLQNSLKQLLENSSFDYKKYFEENSISEEKIDSSIDEVLAENTDVAADIKNGNQGKAGILVGKVLAKTGKGVAGKVIREKIIAKLSVSALLTGDLKETKEVEQDGFKSFDSAYDDYKPTAVVIEDEYRTHLISQLSDGSLDSEVTLSGWVSSLRDHGDLVFIDLRDSSHEIFQIRLSRENFDKIHEVAKIHHESVIMVKGIIVKRGEDDYNPGIRTGKIEMDARELKLLNLSRTLPFEIRRATQTSENVRFKYKFLDHRNSDVRKAIVNRHKVLKLIRDILDSERFFEIETPILSAGTDEGAREFIVPSRKYPGKFYTLPQAPQQFKQMLMVGGFDRYFQVARCFRDEDSRGDRQPEFTQLDMEMAFVSMKDIMDLNTRLFNEVVKQVYGDKWKLNPFRIITYKEAMDKYGCDRPDLRYGLEMEDITDIVKDTSFQVFVKPIEDGGIVKCIKVDGKLSDKRLSKGQIEKLTSVAQEHGLGGLAYIIVNDNDLQSPIIKYLGEDIAARIIERTKAVVGDIVFFSAADYKTANKALDAVRQELAQMLRLINPKELCPAWVIDFPLFEKTDEGNWTFSHNPFSMPKKEDIENHMKGENIGEIISQQYDLILNGFEIGGGSVRAHKSEILEATYRNMGYDKDEMRKSVGHMYDAFQYGAPPHGGIAWGVDRLIMILEKRPSIRDVIAYPKTGSGEDLMFNAPSFLSEKKILEANVKSTAKLDDNK